MKKSGACASLLYFSFYLVTVLPVVKIKYPEYLCFSFGCFVSLKHFYVSVQTVCLFVRCLLGTKGISEPP